MRDPNNETEEPNTYAVKQLTEYSYDALLCHDRNRRNRNDADVHRLATREGP